MIHQSTVANEVLHEGRDWLCLEGLLQIEISDFARVEVHFDLVALFYMVRCVLTFQKGEPYIKGISIKDPRKGLGDDT